MGYNIGPKIGIEGEAQFRSELKRINETYKALEAETRAVTASFEAQGDEQGKLRATSKQLEKQIAEQQKKMGLLKDAVKNASDKYGENSIEATRLRGALHDTQATVSKLEGELKDTNARLDSAGNAMEEFADESKDAGKAALDFGDILSANVISDVIMDGLRELGGLVKDFAVDSIEAAAEVKAANSQLEQTFGDMQASAEKSLQEISNDTNIATTRMQGSFTKIYAFAKTSGSGSAEALTIASRAMVAAADNAAYYDKSIEEATAQIQAFIKGNYANDAALGISATETSRNTKANELYAKSFQELSESQKVDVLLAMVEAGNAASGALGQAARESDSWENVTGELAEAMRQLQAEAGKPALKKLTPIIQKITDKAYELIEDTDWDKFGETVEDIADGVIEYGPGIVKAIAAITAGIVAMKITQKVGEFASLASSIINIGTAATTAGGAVAASGAVAMASPWGLVAGVIGGAVALITLAATSAKDAGDELSASVKRLEDTVAESEARFAETKSEVDGAAYAAQYYVERLEELEAAGLDTAESQREYALVVEQLNELIPDLNLTIDEQTGLVTDDTAAIRANIDAWKENATAKALQDRFSDVLKAQGAATADLCTAKARLNLLTDQHADLEEKLTAKQKQRGKALEDLEDFNIKVAAAENLTAEEAQAMADEWNRLNDLYMSLDNDVVDLSWSLRDNESAQKDLRKEVESAEKVMDSYDDQIREAEASIQVFEESTEAATDAQDDQRLSAERTQKAIAELEQAYADAKDEALESINSQIGLFEELSMESDYSAEKIIQNWQKQQAAFANYNQNLKKAVDMGLDKALVQQLSDGSQESMQILDALVNDTKISVDEINAAFRGVSESRDTLADTWAGMQTDFNNKMAGLQEDVNNSADELSSSSESIGVGIVSSIIRGMNRQQPELDRAAKAIMNSALSSASGKLGVSIITTPAGRSAQLGIVNGSHAAGLDYVPYDGYVAELHAGEMVLTQREAEAYRELCEKIGSFAGGRVTVPEIPAFMALPGNSRTVNYGGINVQIYQQPGESPDDLVERFMDELQTRVAAKEAAF